MQWNSFEKDLRLRIFWKKVIFMILQLTTGKSNLFFLFLNAESNRGLHCSVFAIARLLIGQRTHAILNPSKTKLKSMVT